MLPQKLNPVMKDYIWGGTKLAKYWNKVSDLDKIAESWELSFFPGCESTIIGGEFDGLKLSELASKYPDILGKKCQKFDRFPVLIKLIDATNDLSIQVHPNDDFALKNENELGKTEMWYVADASENASLYLGFNKDVSEKEVDDAIKNNTVCDLLNRVKVKKGDTLFVKSGTVHAILAGVTVIEIQENSSITYRLYDYGRRDKNGNPRELHVQKALKVLDFSKKSLPIITNNPEQKFDTYTSRQLAKCNYFDVKEIKIDSLYQIKNDDCFDSFTVAEGSGRIGELYINKGDTIFLPAKSNQTITGKLTIIETTL